MPTYSFRCQSCQNEFDEIRKLSELSEGATCPFCRCPAHQIITFTGGLQTENVSWLNDQLRGCLQKDGEKPIETRSEYNRYLKENNIVSKG